ncbi:hypothetical protein GGR54DRAFT_626577 [Hypoxylon sp. NC1633]|nr:hypothetical protein GGR54DRAFT_626577 [Hypoxylon sp. NC1633]
MDVNGKASASGDADSGREHQGLVLDFDDVIGGTDPSAFAVSILEEMNQRSNGVAITWDGLS